MLGIFFWLGLPIWKSLVGLISCLLLRRHCICVVFSRFRCRRDGKERWGRIVEWVEKVSFARLNKLFEIDTVERAHNILLSDKNPQALIKNPKSFIIPVFPRLASSFLVPDEHFMLKNLPFYEALQVPHLDFLSKPTPTTPTAAVASDSNEKPSSTDDIPYHKMKKPFVISGNISEESFECLNLSFLYPNPTYVPSQKEMFELLRHIAIAHIIHMQDYIAFETTKVQVHIFQRLETLETMRAYIAHNMDGNEEFLPNLEMARSEVADARKLAEEGAYLLRKVDEENKAS
uniref:Uncharacterized protein n=1 Tax=Vitis vinifera TaxID=29760 RepID=A5BUH5_VITVI|nr:hypothetical protein VITISV_031620 [Vitis vinifera]